VSVGHVARAIEESGIPTVTVMTKAFAHRALELTVPRTLVVRHLLGRPMGAAHDVERHTQVINAAFELLGSATNSGTIEELPECYRPLPVLPSGGTA